MRIMGHREHCAYLLGQSFSEGGKIRFDKMKMYIRSGTSFKSTLKTAEFYEYVSDSSIEKIGTAENCLDVGIKCLNGLNLLKEVSDVTGTSVGSIICKSIHLTQGE